MSTVRINIYKCLYFSNTACYNIIFPSEFSFHNNFCWDRLGPSEPGVLAELGPRGPENTLNRGPIQVIK